MKHRLALFAAPVLHRVFSFALLLALPATSSLPAQEAGAKRTPRLPLDVLVFAPHPLNSSH